MKQEDKELLLKDLCGRLPYKVKVKYYDSEDERDSFDIVEGVEDICCTNPKFYINQYALTIGKFKPYLFPLSSMTEEQKVIYGDMCYAVIHSLALDMQAELNELVDWLNKNHFDYRGLIEKGLAINATNLNIY